MASSLFIPQTKLLPQYISDLHHEWVHVIEDHIRDQRPVDTVIIVYQPVTQSGNHAPRSTWIKAYWESLEHTAWSRHKALAGRRLILRCKAAWFGVVFSAHLNLLNIYSWQSLANLLISSSASVPIATPPRYPCYYYYICRCQKNATVNYDDRSWLRNSCIPPAILCCFSVFTM